MKPASLSAVLVCLAAIVYAAIYATAPFTIGPVELRNYQFTDPPEGTPYDAWIRCDGASGRYVTETGETMFFLLTGRREPSNPDPGPPCGEEQRQRRIRSLAVGIVGLGVVGAAVVLARRSLGALAQEAPVPAARSDAAAPDHGVEPP